MTVHRSAAPGALSSPFLNTPTAAHYLGFGAGRQLERMRANSTGPRFRRHGRLVFYHIDDLDAWSASTSSEQS